jgi:putative FmdB family regulatory protein
VVFKQAYRISEIESFTSDPVREKAKDYSPRLVRVNRKHGRWLFDVGKWRVKVKATFPPRATKFERADVQFTCSCPFWRWQGPEHWGKEHGYQLGKPRGTATFPKVRDPQKQKGCCKHVFSVMQVLKGYRLPPGGFGKKATDAALHELSRLVFGSHRSDAREDEMPVYEYVCDPCEEQFEAILPVSRYREPQNCPKCGQEAKRVISPVGFVLKGDGWPSKTYRVKNQMKKKNVRLASKEREMKGDGMVPSLAPNVEGERVGSWEEAKRLAVEKGKDGSTYDNHIREEKQKKKHGPSVRPVE